MSDIPDIDPGEGDLDISPPETVVAAIAASAAAGACLSCGGAILGAFCGSCGQRNDDLRRSSVILFRDFLADTFSFDSRMWRTLGLLAAAPGAVPTDYSHGKRSRYTPPVRLFLVVSFLFFLTIGLTQTLFVAVEVRPKSPEEIAASKAAEEIAKPAIEKSISGATFSIEAGGKADKGADPIVIGDPDIDCQINVRTRYLVRKADIHTDEAAWRRCADSIKNAAAAEIEVNSSGDKEAATGKLKAGIDRTFAGINVAVADPAKFNSEVNAWLPRVMLLMTPILALIMTLFIRGKDALLFDHLVFSLYSHAAAFTVIGVSMLAAQIGAPHMPLVAFAALSIYFGMALKRAYRRGWIKTIYSTIMIGFLYALILVLIVSGSISGQIWNVGA